jgi:acyl-coenzyme A thioesterase PaaI-like protein
VTDPIADFLRRSWELPDKVEGAWAQRRRLAGVLRRAIHACVGTLADEATLVTATDGIEEALRPLEEAPQQTFRQAFSDGSYFQNPSAYADRNAVIGRTNPLAPPMVLTEEDGKNIGLVTLNDSYSGVPGWVHGGVLAALFDQILGNVPITLGIPTVTSSLEVRYLRPTPLQVELRFEAWLEERKGRSNLVVGRCLVRGETTAEATGDFVHLEPTQFRKMISEL